MTTTFTPDATLGEYPVKPGMRPLSALRAADYNPRSMAAHDRESLIRSLETFGFVDPVIIRDEDGLVIGGHQRLDALRELLTRRGCTPATIGATEVPVMALVGLEDDRAKLLNLALNRISGEWDHTKLAEVLSSLGALPTLEIELSGFKLPEITDYRAMLSGLPALGSGGSAGAGRGGDDAEGGGGDGPATVDGAIEAAALRLIVEFATREEADEARAVLTLFGMTCDRDAAKALSSALRAATQPGATNTRSSPKGAKKRPLGALASE